jgi:hypothetical protein
MSHSHILRFTIAALAVTLAGTCYRGRVTAGESAALVTYNVGARPRAIATGDLDRDGRLDVVVANSGDSTLSVLFGAGSGQLRPAASPIPAGQEPSDVDAVDLDRDGDVDLVVANHETSNITVLLNDGHAHFVQASGSPFNTGARPHVHGLATGDFNGDAWMDVAVESADTKEVRLLRGGPRGLGEAIAISVGTMPYYRLGAADVTGDGHPDVLVPGQGDNTVRVVQREGASLVLAAWTIRLSDKPWMVVGDDVNGDRRTDIIVVHSNAASVWLAGRDGFSPATGSPFTVSGATEVATGDLDGDGIADVAVGPWDGDEVTVLTGPKLALRKMRTCERPIGLAIADLDGDHRGELLVACAIQKRLLVVTFPSGR